MKKKLLSILLAVFMMVTSFTTRTIVADEEVSELSFSLTPITKSDFSNLPSEYGNIETVPDEVNPIQFSFYLFNADNEIIDYYNGSWKDGSDVYHGESDFSDVAYVIEQIDFVTDSSFSETMTIKVNGGDALPKRGVMLTGEECYSIVNGILYVNVKVYSSLKTIADILPSNFPASDEDNSWCNSENDNVYIYKTDSNLVFNDSTEDCYSVPLSSPLAKEENPAVSYVYSKEETIIRFNMTGDNDDELENIVVNNCTIPTCIGTYNPIEIVTYDVTYNANGATSGSAPTNQTKTAGVDLTLATNTGNLAKAGYTFAGWNTKADGSGTHYNTGATYTTDAALTLYAEWIEVPATKTIADILPKNFPTSSAGGWLNENGGKSYIMNGNLFVYGKTNVELSKSVTKKDDGNYEYQGTSGTIITFVMESDKLIKINVSGSVYPENNGTYVAPHVHAFTYTANDNIITATCTEGCDEGYDTVPLTLTLTAPTNLVYDGNAKAFTFADGEADAWTGAGLELPTIAYVAKSGSSLTDNKAVNVGFYTASVTVDTDKTVSLDFEIAKATPYIKTNPAPSDINLGEKLSDSTLFGGYVQVSSTDSTQIAGLFEWTNPDTIPTLADSDVTLYDVTFTPADEYTKNYSSTSCKVTITVNNTAPTNTYTASFYAQNNGGVSLETLTDIAEGTAYSVDGNKITIGDRVITATANQGYKFVSWYDGVSDVTEGGTITKNMTFIAMIEKEWSEWQDFGPMVYNYDVLVTGSGLYSVQTRSDEFGNKQFKVLGWGAGAYSQTGIDLIIDVDSNNICSIEKQEIQTGIWVCDLYSLMPEYEQCVYNPVTKVFTLLVAYHDGAITYGNYETLVFCNEITNDTPEVKTAENHGYLSVDSLGMPGEVITVIANPAEGYQLKLDSLKVTYNDGEQDQVIIPEATQTEGEYTFAMPAYAVVVMAEFEEKAITIADILPEDFPTTRNAGWVNDVDSKLYINNNGLTFGGVSLYNILNKETKKEGNNYTYTSSPYKLTFVMNSGNLVKIITEGSDITDNNGEYVAPAPVAQIVGGDSYYSLSDALAAASKYDIVKLLIDLDTTENINVSDSTILDLNNHTINTTGTITNNGVIVLYNKNASIIDYLLYNVPSSYGAGEELKLPDSINPKYIVPADTFVSSDVDANGNQSLGFAIGDEYLVWNENVKKATQLEVTYSLALGGDIIAPDDDSAQTYVEVTNLKLNKDITIGSNEDGVGTADLSVLSIIDEDPDYSVTGSITANSHKIILNKSGSLTVSDNISFDDSIVVSGVDGMVISKDYDSENGVCIYTVKNEHHYTNNPFTVDEGYSKDLEFVTDAETWEEADVTIKVDGKVLDFTKYDLAYGSLHVTLHGDYIKTLAAGKHTLTTEVTGYATINQDFYIKSKPSPNPGYVVPNTGIEGTYSNNHHSLLKLSSLSLLAIGTYLVIKKKKDNN